MRRRIFAPPHSAKSILGIALSIRGLQNYFYAVAVRAFNFSDNEMSPCLFCLFKLFYSSAHSPASICRLYGAADKTHRNERGYVQCNGYAATTSCIICAKSILFNASLPPIFAFDKNYRALFGKLLLRQVCFFAVIRNSLSYRIHFTTSVFFLPV